MKKFLAARKLRLIAKNGLASDITIKVGMPYWVRRDIEAACPVSIAGMFDDLPDVHGVDLLQAVELAIELVNHLLVDREDGNPRVYWPDGEAYNDDAILGKGIAEQ